MTIRIPKKYWVNQSKPSQKPAPTAKRPIRVIKANKA